MTILLVVVVALLLWGALIGLRRIPAMLSLSPALQAKIRSVLPAVSLTAWLLYIVWAVNTLIAVDEHATIVIVIALSMVVLLFGWFVLRDLVAGIVFVARHPSLRGVYIETAGQAGKVLRTGILGLQLRGDGGETVSLPYSALAGGVLVEHPPQRTAEEFRLRVAIPGEANGDETIELLRKRLLLSPWVNAAKPPTVQVSGSGQERVADIVYSSLNEEQALHVEESLRKAYQLHPLEGGPTASRH